MPEITYWTQKRGIAPWKEQWSNESYEMRQWFERYPYDRATHRAIAFQGKPDAWEHTKVLGVFFYSFAADILIDYGFFVVEEFRRQGIATKLFEAAVRASPKYRSGKPHRASFVIATDEGKQLVAKLHTRGLAFDPNFR